ncbi:MAG: DUF6152 family protein [Sphingomonadaceae bacterium]
MRTIILAAAGALLAMAPVATAMAHHGWSSYDATQVLEVKAALSDLEWANPHATAKVMWQGAIWDVILAPVSRMEARGLSKDMMDKGQTVTLIGYPRTDGTREMRIERIIVGDKTVELR